jgi:hypothetical protein
VPSLAPRPPGFFARYWPAPARAAQPAALGAVLATAIAAATVLTVSRPGLGWLLVGWVAAAGLVAVATFSEDARPSPGARTQILWGAAALALLAVGTVRAAGWLFVLCVPVAAVCGSIALAGGRSARGLSCGAFATLAAALRGLPWFFRGAVALRAGAGTGQKWLRLLAAAGVGVALVLIFGALFASADPTFAHLVDAVMPSFGGGRLVSAFFRFLFFGWGALGAVYLVSRPPLLDRLNPGDRRPVGRFEWMLPVWLLDALFVAFVAVQVRTWFGGDDYVQRTAGLTYAEYARHGFWQLVAVSILTLAVIAVAARKAPRRTVGDRVALRAALGALTVLALVVVASALARMSAYEQAYGLTRLRLLVAFCEVWLGLVFVLVLAAGVRLRGAWVPRAVLGTAVAALLALAVVNPDRVIAERNIDRYLQGGRLDVTYLADLSADAAPALDRLPEPQRSCALRYIAADLERRSDPWYEFNWGRWQGRRIERVTPPSEGCWNSRW